MTERDTARARPSSRKRQTKPIQISHNLVALKKFKLDIFGSLYAKQTQFPGAEDGRLKEDADQVRTGVGRGGDCSF